nr:maturase, mitochondrial [Tanacetum cinerariifolium]
MVEFLGTIIREVPPRMTPIQFLRELEKRLLVKHRIHITACHLRSAIHSKFRNLGNSIPIKELTKRMSGTRSLLDAVQLADTLGTAGAVSQSGMSVRKLSLYTLAGRKAAGEGEGDWARSIRREFPIQIEAPIKKILRRLRDRGLISRRRPWPIHVACLTNVSNGDIVNWSVGIAISPLSCYRCRDNLYQVRTIVDHQIRWSAIFTPAHKHKSSARNIIPKYSKDSNIVNKEGGKTLAEFPNSIELGKLRPGQDPNNKDHSTTSLV